MPGSTPIYGLRYQELADPPHGPNLGQDLALDVETELDRIDGEVDTAQTSADNAQTTADASLRPGVNVEYGEVTVSSDAAGDFKIPHSLGAAPSYVAMSATNGTRRAVAAGLTAQTATELAGSLRNESGGAAVNETRQVLYQAIL